jgi:hypothetical protein
MKHESKMTDNELLYVAEWAEKIGFFFLLKELLIELQKRKLIKV